jgi:hypothetical protein
MEPQILFNEENNNRPEVQHSIANMSDDSETRETKPFKFVTAGKLASVSLKWAPTYICEGFDARFPHQNQYGLYMAWRTLV